MEDYNSQRVVVGLDTTAAVIKIEPEELIFNSENEEESNSADDFPLNESHEKIIKTEREVDCPPTLLKFTEEEIFSAFQKCCKNRSKTKLAKQFLLESVFTTLTQQQEGPNHEEDQFLYNLWLSKYKEIFEKPKVKKRCKKRLMPSKKRKFPGPARPTPTTNAHENAPTRDEPNFSVSLTEPNDVIVTPESTLNCPSSLQSFSEDAISTAFTVCVNPQRLNLFINSPKSLFGKVSTFLTGQKKSTVAERRYMYGIWALKYKHLFLDENRDQFKKYKRSERQKIRRRQQYIRSTNRNNDLKGEANPDTTVTQNDLPFHSGNSNIITFDQKEKNSFKNFEFNMTLPTVAPKVEVESDENVSDAYYSDVDDNTPLSPGRVSLYGDRPSLDDPKLKQKVLIKITRLEGSPVQRTSTRQRLKSRRYCDNSSSESEPDDNEVRMDYDDDIASECSNNVDLVLEGGSKAQGQQMDSNTNNKNSTETICSICERPLSKNLLSFHLRTHFSFEEQKQFLIKRSEKEVKRRKNESLGITQKETPLDHRINQLKNLLDELEKRVAKNNQAVPKMRFSGNNRNKNTKKDYGPPVQCDECGKIAANVYVLKTHKLTKHSVGDEWKHKCCICGHPFGFKKSLRAHLPTHLNLEERVRFETWPGSIEEFLERLNTGQDLSKPPTKKKGAGRPRKFGAPPPRQKTPKKVGRPRKQPHSYKEQDSNGDEIKIFTGQGQHQPQTNSVTESMYSNPYASFTISNYLNPSTFESGQKFRGLDAVPSTSNTIMDTNSALSWSDYTDQ